MPDGPENFLIIVGSPKAGTPTLANQPMAPAQEPEGERMENGWQPLFHHRRCSRARGDLQRYTNLFGDVLMLLGFHAFSRPEKLIRRVQKFRGLTGRIAGPGEIRNNGKCHSHEGAFAALRNTGG